MNDRKIFIKHLEKEFSDIKYGEKPYMYHLYQVESIVNKHYSKYLRYSNLSLAALGHDYLEDTKNTSETLKRFVSGDVIDLIERLTDKEGSNRRERHLNTYALIRDKEEAVIVKVADRIANIEESIKKDSTSKKSMYKKEFNTFKSALFDPRHKLAKKIWDHYDSLYKKINKL